MAFDPDDRDPVGPPDRRDDEAVLAEATSRAWKYTQDERVIEEGRPGRIVKASEEALARDVLALAAALASLSLRLQNTETALREIAHMTDGYDEHTNEREVQTITRAYFASSAEREPESETAA